MLDLLASIQYIGRVFTVLKYKHFVFNEWMQAPVSVMVIFNITFKSYTIQSVADTRSDYMPRRAIIIM